MTWGRAFLSSALCALLVGPVSGILGGIILLVFVAIADGSAEAVGYAAMFVMIVGVVMGLILSGPICTVFGAVMLKQAEKSEEWTRPSKWALVGTASGGLVGMLFWLFMLSLAGADFGANDGLLVFLGISLSAAFLGAISALLMRRMLRRRISSLHEVDTSVFE